ncbi:DNA polymerase II large subunit [Candidatus Marsarchaeota archaeon]|nr:DNA polymerase II large subunit [Candidatus Marsarchaeota archaeon]
MFSDNFEAINKIAIESRRLGFDPSLAPEIKAAPLLADRVEGIIGINGLADMIKNLGVNRSRQELAFEVVRHICSNEKFEQETSKRLLLAVRTGLSILTEGILVAPTEGIQDIKLYKNFDGTNYIAIVYSGPIRSAGGTSVALSVALADYARKLLNIDRYKATQTEIERYLEEIHIYHSRIARLQYLPSESDIKAIIENCEICIDGIPIGEIEVSIHRNLKRTDIYNKQEFITNKVRSGIGLVICEGIAQKAKAVLKYTKAQNLNWTWLNNLIKVEKDSSKQAKQSGNEFLEDIAAGRPILSYADHSGGFRLRYGRCRFSGIASKAVHPATMILTNNFIAFGTQMRINKPGKGCIAVPCDSIEGPFVKLDNGKAFRIRSAEEALEFKNQVIKIISIGDILITFGDFKKTNTPLEQTSYVEELWQKQLESSSIDEKEKQEMKNIMPAENANNKNKDANDQDNEIKFKTAYFLSQKYNIPMHPRYIYDYNSISNTELINIFADLLDSNKELEGRDIFEVDKIIFKNRNNFNAIERLCINHYENEKEKSIFIENDDAQALLSSFGLLENEKIKFKINSDDLNNATDENKTSLEILNKFSLFKIMKRSSIIGARIGRPEKSRQRMMKPAPNGLFPIASYGGKERNIYKAYEFSTKKFNSSKLNLEIARFRCENELINSFFCAKHEKRAKIEMICKKCNRISENEKCELCGSETSASSIISTDIVNLFETALKNLDIKKYELPKTIKGVKGIVNKNKIPEPLEKAILRAMHNVFVFKDGTCRFDATDVPITHFYPKEIYCSVDRLKELGYEKDYLGNELKNNDQLVEMHHQDVIINKKGAEYLLNITKFIDNLLVKYYKKHKFYNAKTIDDLIGHFVITLSPHTSCGVLGRIIGFTDANIGLAHPYMISARRRNADGDEDSTLLLLDGLLNFSKSYLPSSIGGTMDAPLILTINIIPEEVDDEVWNMETIKEYNMDFYEKTMNHASPGEAVVECVGNRLGSDKIYENLYFTHSSSINSIFDSPKKSTYTELKTMKEKVDTQFELMDKLYSINKTDAAQKLIMSHFIPDLIGNLHSFSKQNFRCTTCNAKYRRIPLAGKCLKCSGKLTLTISRGGIEKYLDMAINLSDRYDVASYIKQRLLLIKNEIALIFGDAEKQEDEKQMNLLNFM